MPNENLIPLNGRSKSEAREYGASGCKASGADSDRYISIPIRLRPVQMEYYRRKGIAPEDVDNQMAMIIGLTEAARRETQRRQRSLWT